MEKQKTVAKRSRSKVIPLRLDATFFFEKAVQSMDRLHYEKALKYFQRAVEYEPENPVNHCNMAGILSEMGNFVESNRILEHVLEQVDPSMTECYFYMANNYANMERFDLAEQAIVNYLELDDAGHFLGEAEELIELLSFELDRQPNISHIKSREGLYEHGQARILLEEGRFTEASQVLENIMKQHPDFLAARNNLALAYYYMGNFERGMKTIEEVLELDAGNLHALCNLAIFYHHSGDKERLNPLLERLSRTYPFHHEHLFKLAMTLGLLGEHEAAYIHFKRMLRMDDLLDDPSLYHFTAVAACNTGRFDEAEKLWKQAQSFAPQSDIPRFYLSEVKKLASQMQNVELSYHYHLPFEEKIRTFDKSIDTLPRDIECDPLMRSSFVWALYHADYDTKLQVIQVLGMLGDPEVEGMLRDFLLKKDEDEYLKKVAIFALRSMGAKEPINAWIEGKEMCIYSSPLSPNLPVWKDQWQTIMDHALQQMDKRYDIIQQHDMQTLWVEFLTRVYPELPHIQKESGWAAALEYLTAKMHRRTISYREVSDRYQISISTVRKNASLIDKVCDLRKKMDAIFPQFSGKI